APMEPLMRKNLHYDWHWVWPTGNGDIGNQGVHEMDQCRWMLGQETLPDRVFAFGGRFGYDDDATTPNTEIAIYDYKPAPLILDGHYSSALCHLGNCSYRVGKQVPPSQLEEQIKGDKLAVDAFERVKNHLMANGVDLGQTPPTLGPWLTIDTKAERFTGPLAD